MTFTLVLIFYSRIAFFDLADERACLEAARYFAQTKSSEPYCVDKLTGKVIKP